MKNDTRVDTSDVVSISEQEIQQLTASRATRDRLINALKEIQTICESRERCDKDCMFAHLVDTSYELYGCEVYGCEIMGFVDTFGECHESEAREVYGRRMTNADYIRQMSDEALAEFMTEDFCELLCRHAAYSCTKCDLKLLNWLKQECTFKDEVSE